MGIFSNKEELTSLSPDNVAVHASIAEALPDAGQHLLELLDDLHEESVSAATAEIARVRHPNGGIPHAPLKEIGIRNWKNGPLTLLAWITVTEPIAVAVWASFGLKGQNRRMIEATVQTIVDNQGVPAAATWAVATRPAGKLHVDSLRTTLSSLYTEKIGQITNGDVIKAFRKWRH